MKVKHPFFIAALLILVLAIALAARHFMRSDTAAIALQRGH